jgi:hypothetical protein
MKIRVSVILLALLMLTSLPLYSGGSPYSRYGVGDILSFNSTRTYAFGGVAIGLIGDGFINRLNPAGMADIRYTRFSGAFEATSMRSKTDDASGSSGFGAFQGAAFAIPIDTSLGIVLGIDATPFSSVRYATTSADTTSLVASDQIFYGSGGVSTLGIALSASITQRVHVGAKLQYYYGRSRQYVTAVFRDPSLSDNTFDRSTYYSGFGFTTGLLIDHIGDLIDAPSLRTLTAGLIIQTPVSIDLREEEFVASTDTSYMRNGSFDLPLSFGVGFSYLASDRYLIAADVYTQQWGRVKRDGAHPAELRNSLRAAVGLEIQPARQGESFWKRVAYRIGAYYHSTNVQLNGSGIDELGVTAGFGFPIGPESRLDLGFQLGIRGTTSSQLQRDTIFRFSLGISASEIWFMHFEEE